MGFCTPANLQSCKIAQMIGGNVEWTACGPDFIEADVIRWQEPVWQPERRRAATSRKSRKPPVRIGQRVVTGQVVKIDKAGWVHVEVADCQIEPGTDWWKPIPAYGKGELVRRQSAKIGQGRVDRLLWSDEGARAAIVSRSRFIGA